MNNLAISQEGLKDYDRFDNDQEEDNRPITWVIKRDGRKVEVQFDKVTNRIRYCCYQLKIDPIILSQKVIDRIYSGITTIELDEEAARLAASMVAEHPDWGILAKRLIISNMHKCTDDKWSRVIQKLYDFRDKLNDHSPLISKELYDAVMSNKELLDRSIDYKADYNFDYFGYKTLERGYLLKINGKVVERPNQMWMRVALGIWTNDIPRALQTYRSLSNGLYTHATPTLFNAGTPHPQLSSCYLLGTEDSVGGIFKTISDCAHISKWAGGIGVHISNIRANGSLIRGTNGLSTGLVRMCRMYNETALYINQGGKRKGSIALYLEPWHSDVFEFLELRKSHGDESARARDLFLAMWIPDLFMRLVKWRLSGNPPPEAKTDPRYFKWAQPSSSTPSTQTSSTPAPTSPSTQSTPTSPSTQSTQSTPTSTSQSQPVWWYLMCPDECPNLNETFGEDFEELYWKYVEEGRYKRKVDVDDLMSAIVSAQIETGVPYIGYKDAVNYKSNQKNLGVIKSSNLCIEINEYSDNTETAVCNLASIALPKFVDRVTKQFDYQLLYKVVREITSNLNRVIDVNFYPTPETRKSNMRARPIGIGVQGWADVLLQMRYNFDSLEANSLNRQIFETIYFAFLSESADLAKAEGPYPAFQGSPLDKGIFHFELWKQNSPIHLEDKIPLLSGRWNWEELRTKIKSTGVRNSLGIALMPTASTSQILGNSECFEPLKPVIFTRRTLSGEFILVNKFLLNELIQRGLWNSDMKQRIMAAEGSIQSITSIPEDIRKLYRTVWELSMASVIDQAAVRAPFVDQSMSMNLFLPKADVMPIKKMHLYAWMRGLKTGCYYLRAMPKSQATKFTVDPKYLRKQSQQPQQSQQSQQENEDSGEYCTMEEGCLVCGS